MIKTIKITNNLVDIFWGEGWENWSRIKVLKPQRKVLYLNTKTPNDVRKEVERQLFAKELA